MNIYDVSEHAGVSIATVSRVLNGNPNALPTKPKRETALVLSQKAHFRHNDGIFWLDKHCSIW